MNTLRIPKNYFETLFGFDPYNDLVKNQKNLFGKVFGNEQESPSSFSL